jgi:hypothetical protein
MCLSETLCTVTLPGAAGRTWRAPPIETSPIKIPPEGAPVETTTFAARHRTSLWMADSRHTVTGDVTMYEPQPETARYFEADEMVYAEQGAGSDAAQRGR